MYRRFVVAVMFLVALALPGAAQAQRGMGRGRGGGGGGGGGRGERMRRGEGQRAAGPIVNTVDLILMHRHEMALSEAQLTSLFAIKHNLDSTSVPLSERLEALTPQFQRDSVQNLSELERAAYRERLRQRSDVYAQLHDVVRLARDSALTVLTVDQRKKAQQLEDDQRKANEALGGNDARGRDTQRLNAPGAR